MEEESVKAKKISEVIAELNEWKDKEGDLEVFVANVDEGRFEGLGSMFVIYSARVKEKVLGITRNDIFLRI